MTAWNAWSPGAGARRGGTLASDIAVFVLLAAVAVLIARGAEGMAEPLARLRQVPVTLDPANLPGYALRRRK